MFDIGNRGGGTSIVLATSNDQKNTPEHMIDGKDDTFWSTTGLFPQEFIMAFGSTMDLQRITLSSYNIKHLTIESCSSQDLSSFEPLTERDLPQTDGQLQVEDFDLRDTKATHLRFVIDSGHDHFIAIHKLNIAGNPVH